jgi:hypothetical protein
MAYAKAKLKGNGGKNISLFHTIPSRKHARQMLSYLDSARLLIKTHFYKPQEFHGDTIVSENIIQDLPPD